MSYNTVLISRAILRWQDKVMLCRVRDANYWFLPGGHVEDGEDARSALVRELVEEADVLLAEMPVFVAAVHNRFTEDEIEHYELCMVFSALVEGESAPVSEEPHLEFGAFSLEELEGMKILPPVLARMIPQVIKGQYVLPFNGFED